MPFSVATPEYSEKAHANFPFGGQRGYAEAPRGVMVSVLMGKVHQHPRSQHRPPHLAGSLNPSDEGMFARSKVTRESAGEIFSAVCLTPEQ